MARKKASSRGRAEERRGGGTLLGVMAGLVLGLLAAAAVAIYISGAPMPFVDRASRGPDPIPATTRGLPDPNLGLSSAGVAPLPGVGAPLPGLPGREAGQPPVAGTPSATAPVAGAAPATPDALGELVASLGARGAPEAAAPAPAAGPRPIPTAPAGRYILQVGAFRILEDAEALKARLALLGFEAKVSQALVNGVLVNRVQVGPYANLDAMTQARERLTANQVESTVVRN